MRLPYLVCLLSLIAGLPSVHAIGDSTRLEIRLDQVYQQHNLHGNGIIVAIIDRGVDYQHPDFIDANGDTRIAYIYDMLDETGKNDPDNPYGIGTIYDRTEIDQALDNSQALPANDRYGHGTASTGIAAGNGSGIPSQKYQGVADQATIIVVKAFTDNFPAFGNQPGQTGFFDPNYLITALEFVSDKVAELGLPSVTLMNLGSIGGPTDGSSKVCRAMDEFAGPGKLLVCGVGDDGGGDNRSGGTLTQGDTATLEISKAVAGNVRFDLWYPDNDRLDILIERPNGSMLGPLVSPASNAGATQNFQSDLNYYHRGSDVDFDESTNPRRQVLIDIFGVNGTYKIHLIGATVSQGNFTASLNPATYSFQNKFLNMLQAGSINDYASAFNVITPTDYVYKNDWIDLDGIPRSRPANEGSRGELWIGSSVGPTVDGRRGVDIAAPGEVIFTSYSPNTYYANFRFNMVQDGNGLYGIQTAVSAAAPVVTGVLALMLEVDGTLTPVEAKQILKASARTDAFTGVVPNPAWGYGKLDALGAIEETMMQVSIEKPWSSARLQVYPQPAHNQIHYRLETELPPRQLQLQIFSLQGQLLWQEKRNALRGQLSVATLARGMYLLVIRSEQGVLHQRILLQ